MEFGPRILSQILLHVVRSPVLCCVAFCLYLNNALAVFTTDFGWEFELSWLSWSLSFWRLNLTTWSSALFQPQMYARCINLLHGYLFDGWCSLCSNSLLSSQGTQSPQFAFASVPSVLPLMVFPSPYSNRLILNWRWIFKCCFIDFGLMSP